jgi:predicted permease
MKSRLKTWWRALAKRGVYESDMDAEMRFHIEAYADELVRTSAGADGYARLTRTEALRVARLTFGTVDRTKEECREAQGVSMFENLMQDLRFAFRTMRRSPGFTAIAIVSLALGIGANTAIFTLINDLMLKSLPVNNPQGLVAIGKQVDGGATDGMSGSIDMFPYEFYQKLEANDEAFAGLTAYQSGGTIRVTTRRTGVSGIGAAQLALVTGNYFDVLQVPATAGRLLEPSDDNGLSSRPVVVVSDRYWRTQLGADPKAIGQTITVNSTPLTIVGVAGHDFYGERVETSPTDFWTPLGMQPAVTIRETMNGPGGLYWLQMMARLKPGVSHAQAQQWITMQLRNYILAREGDATPERKKEISQVTVELLPGAEGVSQLRSRYEQPLTILMAVVAVVLLIACANLANFLLAKTLAREHEISTRLALGAGRWRIVRQMLTESLVLSLSGGVLGLIFAYWGTSALIAFVAKGETFTPIQALPDWRVLAFSLGVSLLTGILFGIGPALRVSRMAMQNGLNSSVRSAAGGSSRGSRMVPQILIAAQVALSLVLLVGAGLFLRTLRNLENRDFGFERSHLLVVNLEPKLAGYKADQLDGFTRRVQDRINALPGVEASALSGAPPMSMGSWMAPVFLKGRPQDPNDEHVTTYMRVTPGYFETLRTGLVQGRYIEQRDAANAPGAVVVNEQVVKDLFPKTNPIGQSLILGDPSQTGGSWEIVGVVKDTLYGGPREEPRGIIYLPSAQLSAENRYNSWMEVRTAGDPASAAASVRAALTELDPNLPVPSIHTIQEHVNAFTSRETLISQLSIFFALLALLLVCIGLYGVMTYSVVRRTNEIGVRMALGAQQGGVLWLILRESIVVLLVGIAVGVPATLGAMRLIESALFGLKPSDPLTLAGAAAVVAAVTLLASYLPARRATQVDPMVALRYE